MNEIEKGGKEPRDLVVVGSSAGGVEALSVLVGTLPKSFPAPIVLAQHLDPNHQSTLDLILQRYTAYPIQVVRDREPLEDGKIYVIPSNSMVSIRDYAVEIVPDTARRPRPSVDLLLSTAAEAYGEHLIAVILTGSGSDGAAGAVEVKNHGGVVIIQDPQTARYPAMPLALPPTAIDFEARLEQIGPLLYDLLTGATIPQGEEHSEDILHTIFEIVNRQANIDFRPYKASTILRRIGRRMIITHTRTLHDYAEYLRSFPEEVGELVKAFLINVTQFFRDADAFTYLRKEILPRLIARARERDKVLRCWAAGCATGEEPYSLAMILSDLLGTDLLEWSVKIFATDLDNAVISFARRGIYSDAMLKGIPTDSRDRFFERVDTGYRISKMLRQMVIFGRQDLSSSAPFPRIDLVLCRNVLIYFTPELQDYVLNQFAFSLNPQGYLFLGRAETVRPSQSSYELINKQWRVYRCTGNVLHTARASKLSEGQATQVRGAIMPHPPNLPSLDKHAIQQQDNSSVTAELGQMRRFNELLLRFLPVGVIIIDRSYRIITANSTARRLLGMRESGAEQDFLHSVRGIPYPAVHMAIDSVFRERHTMTLPEVELDTNTGGNGHFLSLSLALIQSELMDANPNQVLISVSDVTEQVQTRKQLEVTQNEQAQLIGEISATNKRLSDVNKELLDANEELQVTNEELVLMHEELQASIEEFETTNEELQATNEELETNSEKLQATNEELETTNDELRARSHELQEVANILESERIRLAEIVELAPFYVLLLRGSNLIVEALNPRYGRILDGRVVQDQPLEDVYGVLWDNEVGAQILQLVRRCFQQDMECVSPRLLLCIPGEGRDRVAIIYCVFTFIPTHNMHGKVDGVIIYAVDEARQKTQAEEEVRDRLKLIFDHTTSAAMALYAASNGRFVTGSSRYIEMIVAVRGVALEQMHDHTWNQLTFLIQKEQAVQVWQTVLEIGEPVRLPEVHASVSPTGEEKVWDYSLIPIKDKDESGRIRFMLVSAVEITEQVRARQELERLNSIKDDFLSLATHELRTPLAAIQGNVELMLHSLRKATEGEKSEASQRLRLDQQKQLLERTIQQVVRMSKLINQMLDVTRMRGKVFELQMSNNVDIVALTRSVIDQASHDNHAVMLEADEESIKGRMDEMRVEQVLTNLLSNAIKYSPKGTTVTIAVKRDAEKNEAVISVRDQGMGISPEDQQHIFNRFYRAEIRNSAKVEGLGLGLYISYEIVQQHGGSTWLESEPNAGSTFYFSLPLHSA